MLSPIAQNEIAYARALYELSLAEPTTMDELRSTASWGSCSRRHVELRRPSGRMTARIGLHGETVDEIRSVVGWPRTTLNRGPAAKMDREEAYHSDA